ncbi:MAG: imidazolonepropionase [Thermoanaerobaculia bacterium]
MGELWIHDLAEVATPRGTVPLAGARQRAVDRLTGVDVLCRDGLIAAVDRPREVARLASPGARRLSGGGGTLVPGFIDAHTHLPWAGTRETEFSQRLEGRTYLEIAARGGGILSTVAATRAASEEELTANTLGRLDRMLAHGTTTAEAKSGYGLSLDDELKQLRAIAAAGARHPIELSATLMAAHEIPPEHRGERARFLDLVCEEIVPAAAEAGLATACDVFCEQGVFTVAESRRVLEAGIAHGLAPRLHADEFVDSGAAELAGALGAVTADHLVAVSAAGIEALARGGVLAGLLPGVSFFLMKDVYAPARRLIGAGVPVTLATDCNPGSSHTESLVTIVQLAVFRLGMFLEEALTAVTLNAACTLGRGESLGTIEPGKQADLVLLDAPNVLHLAYHFGVNPVVAVVKRGEPVHPRETA